MPPLAFDRARERLDHFVVLDRRARPPVQEQQRQRAGIVRLLMDEMDVEAADVRLELAEAIQAPLLRAPVVAVAPVGHQRLDVIEVRPVVPAGVGEFIGETGALQPALEVAQDGVRHLNPERHNRGIVPARSRWARWSLRVQASRQNGCRSCGKGDVCRNGPDAHAASDHVGGSLNMIWPGETMTGHATQRAATPLWCLRSTSRAASCVSGLSK